MKILLTFCILFGILNICHAQTSLTLTITNIKNDKGEVRALLFKGEAGFPDQREKAFKSGSIKIKDGKALLDFGNIPEGSYAISVFHDSKSTGELRTNALGIPKDGYGFSNNVMGTFGPPSYEKAGFKVAAGKNNVSIKLR